MNCMRHIQGSDIFGTLFMHIQTFSSIFSIIKAYSCRLRHKYDIFRFIQAYLEPWVSLAYSQPSLIPSFAIFRTEGIFRTLFVCFSY